MEPFFSPDVFVFYEHTSIPLAVYYVDNGRMRAYLVSDGACRMFEATRDELLERFNEGDPFTNIIEKEEMAEAVKRFSENDERYNVVYHEYVGIDMKKITVHAVGEHEYTKDGRRYSLIRYDEISDSSRRFLFRDEEREQAEREKLLADIDDAIARSYTSVIYIETSDLSAYPVRLNRFGRNLEPIVGQERTLRNVIDVYVRSLVYRDDAQGVLKFGDYDYVINRLKDSNPLYHTYRTIRDGRIVYYRLKIIPFEDGKKLVYGFEHFDDQIREQIARKNELETQTTLLSGLSSEYETVWIVDVAIHHMKLILNNIANQAVSEMIGSRLEGSYENLVGDYIDNFVVAEDRERVYLETALDNLVRKTKEGKIYHVNYGSISTDGKKSYFQLCVVKVTDATGVLHFVYGIRNIDSIIEEQKNRNMLYSMAHMDHMTMLNNRRTFDEDMDESMSEMPEDDLVFFSFDLNELKQVNDNFGHEAGDELIVGTAKCMKEILGQYGDLYRTGGDEFAAIIHIEQSKLDDLIRKLTNRFESWNGNGGRKLSLSMGYVTATEDRSRTLDDMRREAEVRMYARKTEYYKIEGNDRRRNRGH